MIIAEQLTKKYGKNRALEAIDFVLEKDKITGLIGPNGAGKSTLMKIICGYISPTSGLVKVNNVKMNIQDSKVKKNIGYLPENNPLYPDMYIKEYLEYVAGMYKIKNKKEVINNVIQLTGLEKEQYKKIGELSKGYKQRVGLAQAIIHNPDILILDEPTSGLDPNQIVEIRNLISALGKNKTVLLSTHILQEVEAICDKVIIIHNGKIIAYDDTKKIQGEKNNLIVEFDQNPLKEDLLMIEGVIDVSHIKDKMWIFTSDEKNDIRSAIFKFAVEKNFIILSSQIQKFKLEDVFQSLTKKSDNS